MKLVLTSSLSKEQEKSLFESVSDVKGLAVILVTASKEYKEQNRHIQSTKTSFLEVGYEVVLLDVDVDSPEIIDECDILYIAGGNPHYLLKRVKETNADIAIYRAIDNGVPVIATSAGAVILGKSSSIVEVLDPELYDEESRDRIGLNCIDFTVLPHSNRWEEKTFGLNAILSGIESATKSMVLKIPDGKALTFNCRNNYEQLEL